MCPGTSHPETGMGTRKIAEMSQTSVSTKSSTEWLCLHHAMKIQIRAESSLVEHRIKNLIYDFLRNSVTKSATS